MRTSESSWLSTPGLIALLATGIAAASLIVMLLTPGLVHYLDAPVHLCWMQGFNEALSEGVWRPRWSANDFGGLGAPVFVFYAPLAYYLGAIPLGLGAGPDLALRVVYVIAALGTGLGLWLWLRPRLSASHALVWSALATVFPTLAIFGGRYNMPAMALSVATCTFALAMFERTRSDSKRAALGLAAAIAATLYTHLIEAALLGTALGSVAACQLLRTSSRRAAVVALLALAAGTLLAAPHWLPAVLALDTVQPAQFVAPPAKQIASNLLFLADPPSLWPERRLFEATTLLLAIAMIMALIRDARRPVERRDPESRVFAAIAFAALILMTPVALPIYRLIEPAGVLQYAWRWQPLFVLCAMRVIAVAFAPQHGARTSWQVPTMTLLATVIGAATLLGAAWIAPAPPTRMTADAVRIEARGCRHTPPEYLPPHTDAVALGSIPMDAERIRVLSGRARVVDHRPGTHQHRYDIQAELPSRIELPLLANPAWDVRIDGVRVEVENAERIRIAVPNGQSTIDVTFRG